LCTITGLISSGSGKEKVWYSFPVAFCRGGISNSTFHAKIHEAVHGAGVLKAGIQMLGLNCDKGDIPEYLSMPVKL